jgi:hypothetical protein
MDTPTETDSRAAGKAFLTAMLLTKSIERAEAAVLNGICALDVGDLPAEKLVLRTIEGIVLSDSPMAEPPRRERQAALKILPVELQKVFEMPRQSRYVYVLRILIGLSPHTCAWLLGWNIGQVARFALAAIQHLGGHTAQLSNSANLNPFDDENISVVIKARAMWLDELSGREVFAGFLGS